MSRTAGFLLLGALTISSSGEALADVPRLADARYLSPDPNAPTFSVGWLASVRGTASTIIPFVGKPGEPGFMFSLLPLIALHNMPFNGSVVPFQYWRGRAALEASYAVDAGGDLVTAYALIFSLEHESDHETDSGPPTVFFGSGTLQQPQFAIKPSNFLHTNSATLRGGMTMAISSTALSLYVMNRLHLISCTDSRSDCSPREGSSGYQWGATLVADFGGLDADAYWLRPIAALSATGVVPGGRLIAENRVHLHAGVRVDGPVGAFQLVGALRFGKEIGFLRHRDENAIGLLLRWSPFD